MEPAARDHDRREGQTRETFTSHAGNMPVTEKGVVVGVRDLWSVAEPSQNRGK